MFRNFARSVHFYCGITLGIFFSVIALSGAILVFYVEIDAFITPELGAVKGSETTAQAIDWDKAVSTLRAAFPDKSGPWRLEVSPSGGAIPARYHNPPETRGEGFAPMMVWLSADASEVVRRDYWGSYLVTWVYNLHYQLLMGKRGRVLVACLGLVLVLMLISGAYTWWPRKHRWAKALHLKPRANALRRLYDLHKIIGLGVCIPALLLSGTGVMLALPVQTKALLAPFFGATTTPGFTHHSEAPLYGTEVLPLSLIVGKAKTQFKNAHLAWLEVPPVAGGYYRLRFQVEGDPSKRFPHSHIELNAHTAKVTQLFDIRRQSAANTINNWLHPLHDGSAFGLVGRICWVIVGVALFALWGTGFTRWLLRRRRLRRSHAAQPLAGPTLQHRKGAVSD